MHVSDLRPHHISTGAVLTYNGPVEEIGVADEIGDELVGRMLVDVARPSDLLDAPLVHHADLV